MRDGDLGHGRVRDPARVLLQRFDNSGPIPPRPWRIVWQPVERITHRTSIGIRVVQPSAINWRGFALAARSARIISGRDVVLVTIREHDEQVEGQASLGSFGEKEMVGPPTAAVGPRTLLYPVLLRLIELRVTLRDFDGEGGVGGASCDAVWSGLH